MATVSEWPAKVKRATPRKAATCDACGSRGSSRCRACRACGCCAASMSTSASATTSAAVPSADVAISRR
eukprot:418569-Prymnesium_polylepis.1